MASYINIHLQLTKDVLQSIGKDNTYVTRYQHVERILSHIYENVQRCARKETKLVYNLCYDLPLGANNDPLIIPELMKKLAAEFTGCKIEHIETKGYHGNIVERFIIIDWC